MVVAVSNLMLRDGSITEIDLNPVFVLPHGVRAVDARIIKYRPAGA